MIDDDEQSPRPVFERIRPWLIGGVAAGVMGGVYYFLATRGPRAVEPPSARVESSTAADLAALSREVDALEAAWQAAEANGQGSTAEARATLASAVEKQRRRVRLDARATPAESERLRALERQAADLEVRDTLGRISTLEAEALAARAADRPDEAREKLRAALGLMEQVNRSNAAAAHKDLGRETRMKVDWETWQAEPLHQRLLDTRALAERAARAERWTDVRRYFEQVRQLQVQINREYPRTPFVDLGVEDELEMQIQSLQAEALAVMVRESVGGGEEKLQAGQPQEAARLFAQALAAQEKINTTLPRSRQRSASALEDIEARRQTALSLEALGRLNQLEAEIMRHLAAGEIPVARKKITESAEIVAQTWREYPRSKRLDDALRERVLYRAKQAGILADVRDAVSSQLQAVSGPSPVARILQTEVPQALYARIMDKNPSRNAGDAKPVDSVSWHEAAEFCRRLGWLLGARVRLPTEAEHRALLTETPPAFAGLRGGLAEWLDAAPATPEAPVAGGSYLDTPEALAGFVLQRLSKNERARHVGFRIVVSD